VVGVAELVDAGTAIGVGVVDGCGVGIAVSKRGVGISVGLVVSIFAVGTFEFVLLERTETVESVESNVAVHAQISMLIIRYTITSLWIWEKGSIPRPLRKDELEMRSWKEKPSRAFFE